MKKKMTGKSKAAKSVKDLPAKAPNARTAKGVKGGTYGAIEWTYTKQKPDGTASK